MVLLADPYLYPKLLDAARLAILEAGAIEQAVLPGWTPGPRDGSCRPFGILHRPGPVARAVARGRIASRACFGHRRCLHPAAEGRGSARFTSVGETEWIQSRWKGRGVYFHWSLDPQPARLPDEPTLGRDYERAVLDLDYGAHRAEQEQLANALRGSSICITTPSGSDLTLRTSPATWFHLNDGIASKAKLRLRAALGIARKRFPPGTCASSQWPTRSRVCCGSVAVGAASAEVSMSTHSSITSTWNQRGNLVRADAGPRQAEWKLRYGGRQATETVSPR